MSENNSGPIEAVKGIVEGAIGFTKQVIGLILGRSGLQEEGKAQVNKASNHWRQPVRKPKPRKPAQKPKSKRRARRALAGQSSEECSRYRPSRRPGVGCDAMLGASRRPR